MEKIRETALFTDFTLAKARRARPLLCFMTPDRWRELEELYQEARALHPSRRNALLNAADPESRDDQDRFVGNTRNLRWPSMRYVSESE